MPPRLAARVQTPGFLMPSRLAARVQMLLAQPPEELSAEEAEVWRLTVEGMRPDWFGPEVRPLLRAYCTQTALAQFLAQELRALAVGDKSFGRLAGLHARPTKMIHRGRLASAMGNTVTASGPRPRLRNSAN
jgi:hypothetical protein